MKTLQFSLLCFTFFMMRSSSEAQGSFQNIGFESATLVQIPGDSFNRVYFDQAFPGWRGYVGAVQETAILSNNMFLCCSAITVVDQFNPVQRIEGNFSVLLHAAFDPYSDPSDSRGADTSLAQTGLIPVGSQSLLFKAYGVRFAVSLGGQDLSLIPLSSGPNYIGFGADVSAWAGREGELRFTALAGDDPGRTGGFVTIDSIEFSTTPVPEPSTLALLGVGGVLGWLFWRRNGAVEQELTETTEAETEG